MVHTEALSQGASPVMTREARLTRYRHLRAINSAQQSATLKLISRATLMDYARRLGLLHGRTFVCDSATEMALVFDLTVHTAPHGRSRAIDRYARSVPPRQGSDEAIMLKAAQDACFRILKVEGRQAPVGLSVRDLTTGEKLWLIDEGLEASAPVGAIVAGRMMAVEDFVMTCGVVVPLDKDVLLEAMGTVRRSSARNLVEAVREPSLAVALFRAAIHTGVAERMEFVEPDDARLDEAFAA